MKTVRGSVDAVGIVLALFVVAGRLGIWASTDLSAHCSNNGRSAQTVDYVIDPDDWDIGIGQLRRADSIVVIGRLLLVRLCTCSRSAKSRQEDSISNKMVMAIKIILYCQQDRGRSLSDIHVVDCEVGNLAVVRRMTDVVLSRKFSAAERQSDKKSLVKSLARPLSNSP